MESRISLTQLLEKLDDANDGRTIHLQDVVDTFQSRGFGPLVTLPALLALLPTGGVPGVPTLCAIFIALIAVQQLFGRQSPWLPRKLRERGISHDKLHRSVERVRPWTRRIDRLLAQRLDILLQPVARRFIAVLVIALALAMIPLELLPFAAAMPALAITVIGLGMTADDGLLLLIGVLLAAGLAVSAYWLL
ncbi:MULTISPECIES: exopolysaccharide biosynthesis protein [Chromohalobacter]|uniref:Exopolysaccharide synthesis, ExoD n=1 Tax=Chromohalobacter israelensis (strain ATCC BAA-138 / DSM 3043 / CIP 106854 / NCIMB 13768 / 1H11) TaxID=290398 RepID=Q1QUL0_CHRI1|nr:MULTISPECIES: exopolysaccharide biosynthesis protein [Chromohalobacter]ABE59848.1 Exopolysaccharide synthesis, ExoD [Chromohalobacter salexigens DSM 3043]MBZ5877248.1 exopolysaccharide biosynthesis protein [Chromohalobacter salexigens]MDO0947237.1 exopolysaccharide biosynthesis protein [Chromohalobacter salexigens]NQY46582.1 exopolysaccharide biosynthesis protein [Chromohalobacter sp.]NWO57540.1 exopolysaccharide biosynthesis protein exod [Chromohalobacter salexigens]